MRVMGRELCWFEKCREHGALADIDRAHPRILCANHESGIRLALDRPGTYWVSWGRSKQEKMDLLSAAIVELEAELATMPEDPPFDHEADVEDPWALTPREVLESRRETCQDRLSTISDEPWDDPVVRVGVVTQEDKPREPARWKPPA